MNNKKAGDQGEIDLIEKVKCPNCNNKLMLLPKSFPLVDVQCSSCHFRAQVKSIKNKPKNQALGAGWEIMNKVLKAGYLVPSVFFNYTWNNDNSQEIRFYPFIPWKNLSVYSLPKNSKRANYKMFRYIDLNKIPFFVVYKK